MEDNFVKEYYQSFKIIQTVKCALKSKKKKRNINDHLKQTIRGGYVRLMDILSHCGGKKCTINLRGIFAVH